MIGRHGDPAEARRLGRISDGVSGGGNGDVGAKKKAVRPAFRSTIRRNICLHTLNKPEMAMFGAGFACMTWPPGTSWDTMSKLF